MSTFAVMIAVASVLAYVCDHRLDCRRRDHRDSCEGNRLVVILPRAETWLIGTLCAF